MEYREGKSIPVVKEFQVESPWDPWTPIRPSLARARASYECQNELLNQTMLRESEDFLSRFSRINQTQTQTQTQSLLSGSISSMERNTQNTPNFDDIWDRGNVELQRRGLEDYLPPWDSQGRRTIHNYGSVNQRPSNYPCLNSMDLPLLWRNNGVRENVGMLRDLSDDPFGQFDNMSFGDLLGMKGPALELSIVSTRLGDCSGAMVDSFFLGSSSAFRNQEASQDLNQQFNGVFGQEMENSASIYQKWNLSNVNSTPINKHTVGSSTLAPPTPDLLWRSGSSAMSRNISVTTPEKPNEQNQSHENEAAAEVINLQEINNKEVTKSASDSPGQVSEARVENHDRDTGHLDLNKTPQKKPRRKRYMPKVVKENKPKRTVHPKTPKACDSKDPQKPKRAYVRKSKQTPPSASSPNEATKTVDPKPTKPAAKSCKKSLKFDLNGQVTEDIETQTQHNDHHTTDPRLEEELVVETLEVGIAYDLNHTLNQELKNYMALPEQHNCQISQSDQGVLTEQREKMMRTNLAQSSNSSPCASSNEGVQTRGLKRARYVDAENVGVDHGKFGQPAHNFLYNANICDIPGIQFPEICKKRRTDKGQRPAADAQNHRGVDPIPSKYYYSNPVPYETDAVTNNQVEMLKRDARNHEQLLNTWLDISRLKKKRTKSTTRVRDLASLEGIASVSQVKSTSKGIRRSNPVSHSNYLGNSRVVACIEALTEEVHGTPRWKSSNKKGKSVAHSPSSKSNQRWDLVLYDGNRSMKNRRGHTAKASLIKTASLEAITEGLKLLNINKKGHKVSSRERNALVPSRRKTEQNALVPYGNDSTLMPYDGPFDPTKKRRQRAKVELDDETTRVWRLLLENIDNEGIDGTDEEKAKWWENERGVFRGRVDSFIARMRLVQGDRRFTPWKGSVLDSVIGVFLTQNVSDHLSSSAFMCLAARFPIKSDSCESTLSEEGSSTLVVEQEVCITEPEEGIAWSEKSPDQPICDSKSRVIYNFEEKEVVNGEEIVSSVPSLIGNVGQSSESSPRGVEESRENKANSCTAEIEVAARDDETSSQQSVMSSQNSVDSPVLHRGRVMNSFLESSSKCHFNHSTSFLGLLKMAESPFLNDSFVQIFYQDQSELFKQVGRDSLEVPGITPSDYQVYQKSDFHMKATTGIGMMGEESITPNALRKDEVSTTEQSNMTAGSMVQPIVNDKELTPRSSPENASSCYVLEGEEMIMQSQTGSRKDSPEHVASSQQQSRSIWKSPDVQNSLQGTSYVTASTTSLGGANNKKEAEHISKNNHVSSGTYNTKPKKGKAVKDKKNAYDWDDLRKQAQVNGHKKERTANTRDSIDWEAVMRADVSVISETIKERGMNNMLAERIKDLLDRLVKDHGSIDLEWLRDIPPDKAKEYLLSFRGLGLKSVECVRLLTLHHLAFPVDTNVGRIAVRLGWVPLQPLPEQLQLHLLELYPVLESIQKYLWPRLCKLDQKTLYELHYHMITFGKVFCTKRAPNCNACPLRGECRHFASAFASARLALPGPEEKRIVPSVGSSSTNVNSRFNIDPLPLPLWSNHYTEENLRCDKGAPTVEVPSTPLSLPLTQPIHHLERNSRINCEPIVEIPGSPEPEPEQEQTLCDIEDALYEDPNEIPTIKLNMKEFTQTLQNFMEANRELQETGMSKALVALTPDIASIPTPKLKNISRLRTEHHVYELPDTHPLLKGMDKRESDDPCSYLLAIWTPGETADSIQPPERRCNFDDPSVLCNEETCSYCSSQREANSQIVRGTLLIPCRTAMRGSFPLNGTYFQVNEVFADHDSSLKPIDVPRSWLWNLPRRTVYFGTSVPTIFRGLNTEDIQHCFWRGYVCVRGFDQRTRAPRPLMARLHFPASRMPRGGKGKTYDDE